MPYQLEKEILNKFETVIDQIILAFHAQGFKILAKTNLSNSFEVPKTVVIRSCYYKFDYLKTLSTHKPVRLCSAVIQEINDGRVSVKISNPVSSCHRSDIKSAHLSKEINQHLRQVLSQL